LYQVINACKGGLPAAGNFDCAGPLPQGPAREG
jgi:hypothetical protein